MVMDSIMDSDNDGLRHGQIGISLDFFALNTSLTLYFTFALLLVQLRFSFRTVCGSSFTLVSLSVR
jgi:hypothetical protein